MFVEVTGGKLVGGAFLDPLSLMGLTIFQKRSCLSPYVLAFSSVYAEMYWLDKLLYAEYFLKCLKPRFIL